MESIQEAFLMLNYDNLEGKDQVQPWQLCGLIVHAYNLHRGLKCSGFDEDDPDTGEIINLPSSFIKDTSEIMGFRYKRSPDNKEIMMKLVPNQNCTEIDVNAICGEDEIFSTTLKSGHLDLTAKDKALLDNLDNWAVEGDKPLFLISKAYIKNIIDKLCP